MDERQAWHLFCGGWTGALVLTAAGQGKLALACVAVGLYGWLMAALHQGRRPRRAAPLEAARAALIAAPPGVVLAAIAVFVLWLRPQIEHARGQPAGDTPGFVAAPPPPDALEAALPLGIPLPLAIAGTTLIAVWLAAFLWRLRRPGPEDSGQPG